MAIIVSTNKPKTLVERIGKYINIDLIETWSVDAEGDFTHTSRQWRGRAWMRPNPSKDKVIFNIIGSKEESMSKLIYGVYHGRFTQMLLTHFDDMMESVEVTVCSVDGDLL